MNVLVAAAVAAAALAASAAVAETSRNIVRTADLDLSTAAGQLKLRHRVASAVEAGCGSYADAVDTGQYDEITRCRRDALRDAAPMIAALQARPLLASR